ncbi:hypothetical protein PZ938_18375 [Luteipulveratus sp. YIM 133132]|uniref:hypothetical protein n=1 Tax=Luteipulveratus flavus TaxID=3031728 RepID=UPI0023AF3C2A|nr:hypothetical protein [Luteipulveratus sp. YIM 133132]MDE9367587.1 hypothetical protein [Luteipulveratus sp. YIM 133132]
MSRAQLRELGIDRWRVRDQVAARRWRLHGLQTVAVHTGELSETAHQWRALWECGRAAALDGVTALQLAGLRGLHHDAITLSVPGGRGRRAVDGVVVRTVERRVPGELMASGPPRVRPEVAVLRAAGWASTDRQAGLLVVMAAQQRILPLSRMPQALEQVGLHWRRRLIRRLVADVVDGAQALGELDFGALCRAYGLPAPTRQVVRTTSRGRSYLDAGWPEIRLFVEVDGMHHHLGSGPVDDALRQNELVIDGDTVLRLPLLGVRVREAELMGQVVRAHRLLSNRAAA